MNNARKRFLAGGLVPGLVLSCCTGAAAEPTTRPKIPPEFVEAARDVERKVAKGEFSAAGDILDLTKALAGMWKEFEVGPKDQAHLRRGIAAGIAEGMRQMLSRPGMHFKLTAVCRREGSIVARYRLAGPTKLNYMEYHLVKNADGRIRARDLYYAAVGIRASDLARRMSTPALVARDKSAAGPRAKAARDFLHASSLQTRAREARTAGKYAKALAILDEVPKQYRYAEWVMIDRLQSAGSLSDEVYVREAEQFRTRHPHSAAWAIVGLHYYEARNDCPGYLRAIDAIAKRYGNDAFVRLCRSGGLARSGKLPRAVREVKGAIEREPDLLLLYGALVRYEGLSRNWAGVCQALDAYERASHLRVRIETVQPILTKDLYQALLDSDEYKQWAARRKAEQAEK